MVAFALDRPTSDARIISLISVGHFFSHFFQLALPPLFAILKGRFGVSYAELGLLMTGFFIASGVAQTPSGFLVDRFGAPRVLISGLALLAGAVLLIGFVPSFWLILPLMVLAGIGNSVFHPADYAILTGRVSPRRMATAYAVHSTGGTLGWAAAPVVMLALGTALGWRGALIASGLVGLVVVAVLIAQRPALTTGIRTAAAAGSRRHRAVANLRLLTGAAVLSCFGYFAFLSLGQTAFQTFLPSTLNALQGTPLVVASAALTGFLLASAVGTLAGGVVADRLPRHEMIVAAGLTVAALLTLVAGWVPLSDAAIVALVAVIGGLMGMTMPSRDMLVRAATPPGASGRVFGFVYSGLDLGAAVSPLIVGLILDAGAPRQVFSFIAVSWAVTILAAILVKGRTVLRPA